MKQMKNSQKLFMDYRVYITAFVATMVSEWIGAAKIPLGPGNIILLPMIYAMILCLIVYLMK
ncbi:MAG: DUF3100 domain-containing protein, partial [Clostridiales bacterium]|nr:DUF3100 domain-containing protein [Clostridiales bacterium]